MLSSIQDIENFKTNHNNIFFDETHNKEEINLNINLNHLLDLDLINSLFNIHSLLKNINTSSKDELFTQIKQDDKLLSNQDININLILTNIHITFLFNQLLMEKEISIYSLDDLSYKSFFLKYISINEFSYIHNLPNIKFNTLLIDKYSHLFIASKDKRLKKETLSKLKLIPDSKLNITDKCFFNLYFNKKYNINQKTFLKLKNEFLLQEKLYLAYEEYLVLLTILNSCDLIKINEALKLFFNNNNIFAIEENQIPSFISILKNSESYLFFLIFSYLFLHFDSEELSAHKSIFNDNDINFFISKSIHIHKKFIFTSFLNLI